MIAYRLRQIKINELNDGKLEAMKPLDYALWGNLKPEELEELVEYFNFLEITHAYTQWRYKFLMA